MNGPLGVGGRPLALLEGDQEETTAEMALGEVPELDPEDIRRHACRLSVPLGVTPALRVEAAGARLALRRVICREIATEGGCPRPRRRPSSFSCRVPHDRRGEPEFPDPPRRPRRRRAWRRGRGSGADACLPPRIRVEIQTLEVSEPATPIPIPATASASGCRGALEERRPLLDAAAADLVSGEERWTSASGSSCLYVSQIQGQLESRTAGR